jgi:hypothetical protein
MKKAPIAIALVLVFGLFAAAFSLAPAVAQYTPPTGPTGTDNSTSTSSTTGPNATGSANTTTGTTNATGGETFSARGSIATLIFDIGGTTMPGGSQNTTTASSNAGTMGNTTTSGSSNTTTSSSNATSSAAEEMKSPYVATGDWNLDVRDGRVSDFAANFTMVHVDGTGRHVHELSNFASSNSSKIDTSGQGTSFIFGTVDVATDGQPKWTGANALIIIDKNNVVSLSLATEDTDNHFMGQPIYGVVKSLKDQNGNEMIQTGAAGGSMTGANATGGNATSGNQTGGGILGNITEGIGNMTEGAKDLFGGGQ